MRNTEFKCLCCGFQGSQEEFNTAPHTIQGEQYYFEHCPHCGSSDVLALIAEDSLVA